MSDRVTQALDGIRILDLSWGIAGPMTTPRCAATAGAVVGATAGLEVGSAATHASAVARATEICAVHDRTKRARR